MEKKAKKVREEVFQCIRHLSTVGFVSAGHAIYSTCSESTTEVKKKQQTFSEVVEAAQP